MEESEVNKQFWEIVREPHSPSMAERILLATENSMFVGVIEDYLFAQSDYLTTRTEERRAMLEVSLDILETVKVHICSEYDLTSTQYARAFQMAEEAVYAKYQR